MLRTRIFPLMNSVVVSLCLSIALLLVAPGASVADAAPADAASTAETDASAAATAEAEAVPAAARLWVILDPETDSAQRVEELGVLKRAAEAGDHASRCVLGRLAAGGSRHPAKLPEFDLGDANTWLSRCVLGGDLDAMLVMAEVKLGERKPLDAMIWMQGYLKLAGALAPETVNQSSSYKAGILARIERAYATDRPKNEDILEYVAGFLDQFGARISKGYHAGGMASMLPLPAYAEPKPSSTRGGISGRFTRDYTNPEDELSYASFLLEVGPDGKPAKILTLEIYPGPGAMRPLRNFAISRRYVETAETTWAYLFVTLDNKAYDLLPDADSKRRPQVR